MSDRVEKSQRDENFTKKKIGSLGLKEKTQLEHQS